MAFDILNYHDKSNSGGIIIFISIENFFFVRYKLVLQIG